MKAVAKTMALIIIGAVSGTVHSRDMKFEAVLFECLAGKGASIEECGRIASLETDGNPFEVTRVIDAGTGEDASASRLKRCERPVDDPDVLVCSHYDCAADPNFGGAIYKCDFRYVSHDPVQPL